MARNLEIMGVIKARKHGGDLERPFSHSLAVSPLAIGRKGENRRTTVGTAKKNDWRERGENKKQNKKKNIIAAVLSTVCRRRCLSLNRGSPGPQCDGNYSSSPGYEGLRLSNDARAFDAGFLISVLP